MPGNKQLRVLLAEDSPGDVAILEHILTNTSVELRHCASLSALKEQSEKWDPDAVLLDLHLEDSQDFMVTARTVVSMFPQIPVLALTSLDDEGFALRALQAGLSSYLIKGTLSGADLLRAIKEAQARKRAQHLSLPPSIRREDIQDMVRDAVHQALRESQPEKKPSKKTRRLAALVVVVVVGLLAGTGYWAHHKIQSVRNAPKTGTKSQNDLSDAKFEEFQELRNQYLEERTRWENNGEVGSRPQKLPRLQQLEDELAKRGSRTP